MIYNTNSQDALFDNKGHSTFVPISVPYQTSRYLSQTIGIPTPLEWMTFLTLIWF